LDINGDRWTLLLIRDLASGSTRFKDFSASPEMDAGDGPWRSHAASFQIQRDVLERPDLSFILEAAVEFEQKDAKDTKSVTCEGSAPI
jgi:hypothetical protein